MNYNTSTTEVQSIISTLNPEGKPKEIEVINESENMNANVASTLINENSFINEQDSHILNSNSALALSQGIPESISIDSFGKIVKKMSFDKQDNNITEILYHPLKEMWVRMKMQITYQPKI